MRRFERGGPRSRPIRGPAPRSLLPAAPRQDVAFARRLHSGRRNFGPAADEGLHGAVAVVHRLYREGPTMTNSNESDAKGSKGVRSTSGPRGEAVRSARRRARGTATGAADAATSRVKGVASKANPVATGRTPPDDRGRTAPKVSEPGAAALKNLAGRGAGAVQGTTGAVDSTLRGTTEAVDSTLRGTTEAVDSTLQGTVGTVVSTLRTGVGAGLSLVVHKALLLLQLLRRIALQAIEALRQLARRLREYGGVEADDSAEVDEDEEPARDGAGAGGDRPKRG